VADPLGLSVEEAASGIIRVVNANMVRGISTSSVKRGYDVREFSLLPYGGAGPLHAVELAQDMEMRRVIVPPYPGTFSALGVLVADTRYDYVSTLAKVEGELTPEDLQAGLLALEKRGRQQLAVQHVAESEVVIEWSADLRYQGQSYELNTPITHQTPMTQANIQEVVTRFHELHYQVYAYGSREETVEFVNLRVAAIGRVPEVRMATSQGKRHGQAARSGTRKVYFPGHGFLETAVYRRDTLQTGQRLDGPCVVEEVASTTVVTPDARAAIDPFGNLIIDWNRSSI
jgi:N-methylhydantoinase A